MKKALFAALFAFATLGFTACDNNTATTQQTTETTPVDQEIETTPEETVAPADTAVMSADTTAVH